MPFVTYTQLQCEVNVGHVYGDISVPYSTKVVQEAAEAVAMHCFVRTERDWSLR